MKKDIFPIINLEIKKLEESQIQNSLQELYKIRGCKSNSLIIEKIDNLLIHFKGLEKIKSLIIKN